MVGVTHGSISYYGDRTGFHAFFYCDLPDGPLTYTTVFNGYLYGMIKITKEGFIEESHVLKDGSILRSIYKGEKPRLANEPLGVARSIFEYYLNNIRIELSDFLRLLDG